MPSETRRPSLERPAPPGAARRRLVPLGLVFLSVGLSTAMAGPFLALFLTAAVHADGAQSALFLAAAPVSSVAVTTLVGKLSDRMRARGGLLAAAAVAGCAGAALTAVVRDYRVLLLVTVTVSAVSGSLMPQIFAYARESLEGSGRVAMTMSSLRSLFSVAWVAGPPMAAALLRLGGFTLVYAAAAAMYAVAGVVSLTGLREVRPEPGTAGPPDPQGASPPEPVADASRALLWAMALVFVLIRCAGSLAVQGLSLFTTRVIHASVSDAGLLLGLCAALEIPLMLGFGVLSMRYPVRRLLIVGAACGLAYMAIVSVSTGLWPLVAGQVLNATAVAATTGLGITCMQDMLPRNPGRASTLFTNTFAIGAVLAGPVLGAGQDLGYRMPFVVGTAMSALALALLVVINRRQVRAWVGR